MPKIIKKIKIIIDNFLRKNLNAGFCDVCYKRITKNLKVINYFPEDETPIPYEYIFLCNECEENLK